MYYKFNSGINHSELKFIPQIKDLIPDHLTCLLRNLYAGQEALELDMVPNQEKSTSRLCIVPAYLTYMQSTSQEMLDWMKHKLESRLPGEISITSDMQMIPPYGRKQRTKEPLDESGGGE